MEKMDISFFKLKLPLKLFMAYDIALTGITTDLDLFVFVLTPDYKIAETSKKKL